MQIRSLTEADLSSVAVIITATGLFDAAELPHMTAPYLSSAAEFWLVAETDAEIQGVVYVAPERVTDRTWNMLCIAVHPTAQGRGIGKGLIAAVEAKLAAQGQRLLLVETGDNEEFRTQRAFYEKSGFTFHAIVPDFYEDGLGKCIFSKRLIFAE